MTDDESKPTSEKTLHEVAAEGLPISGNDRMIITHPWNVRHPQPSEPEPPATEPVPRYRLTMTHNSEKKTGSDELVGACAEADSMEQLLELSAQLVAIDYHFVSLELIKP